MSNLRPLALVVIVGSLIAAWSLWTAGRASQPEAELKSLAATYETQVRPLLKTHCFACHEGDRAEAEIDLSVFTTLDQVRRHSSTWIKVREMLESGQMPPKDEPQPSDEERKRLQQWVRDYLTLEARAQAGDPGSVVLRRLSNDEYTYTLRDLTGVESLAPAHEFPVDGAAGEGFTNAGSGLVMSPSLLRKYLDAAREVADHAMLLPDGIRFSPSRTRRDFTDELLAEIQAFYRQFTEDGGGSAVNLQGIKFDTNQGGRLPLSRYLAAVVAEREAIRQGRTSLDTVARERGLSAQYLHRIWNSLVAQDTDEDGSSSLLVEDVRRRLRNATPENLPELVRDISRWQDALWKYNPVGQIGRAGGPPGWMEPVTRISSRADFRLELNESRDPVIHLVAGDLSEGREQDFVIWDEPQIVFKDRPAIALRDIRPLLAALERISRREEERTREYLEALVELERTSESLEETAASRKLDPTLLQEWSRFVSLGRRATPQITGLFTQKVERAHGYEAVNGWGVDGTPNMLTNRSDQPISFLTLTVPARGVTVHPSPQQESIIAWRSPVAGKLNIHGLVADADDKCGNGAAWRLEHQAATGSSLLAEGDFANGGRSEFRLERPLDVRKGDVLLLVVNARNNNHSCDTTHVSLTMAEVDGRRQWDLASDVVDNILKGNPLPDSYGHEAIWHFGASESKPPAAAVIPPGSLLAQWRAAVVDDRPAVELRRLADAVQQLVVTAESAATPEADRKLRALLRDWHGPLQWVVVAQQSMRTEPADAGSESIYGLPAGEFGRHPLGAQVDETSLCVKAPRTIDFRLPSRLVAGGEFVVTGTLHAATSEYGTVHLNVATSAPRSVESTGPLSTDGQLVALDDGPARERLTAALDEFRQLFPPALCYARIVPVDEVVTLTLFYREDDHLRRLMLDEAQAATLDRLWDELYFVSREPLQLVVAFEQIAEFATQDRPDLVEAFKPLRQPILDRAEAFRQRMVSVEPAHLNAVLEFADRAWRRPLTKAEQQGLRDLYGQLRATDIPHDEAIRLTLARVLTSPIFLYRQEQPATGNQPGPVTDHELAVRLSYFLWSSLPDDELRGRASEGKLRDDKELSQQARRMLDDPRTRRMAIQFACQWLHVRDFDQVEEKNEALFPEFAQLRGAMYEETVRFFEDMFRNNGSVLDLIDADHTFLNEELARLYGLADVKGTQWRRVEGVRARGRGGVLSMATVLASQSGASRTSPILRGNWVSETLLGEKLPRPPANVPQLPDTVPSGLTERQLIEHHSSVPACAKCHARIDPYGFALEQYDVLGRIRPEPMDTRTTLVDGTPLEGLDGLRKYLLQERRDDVLRQFCRKLLGYALGREVQLSDEVLLDEMQRELAANDYRFQAAVETIIRSRQFRMIRPDQWPSDVQAGQ